MGGAKVQVFLLFINDGRVQIKMDYPPMSQACSRNIQKQQIVLPQGEATRHSTWSHMADSETRKASISCVVTKKIEIKNISSFWASYGVKWYLPCTLQYRVQQDVKHWEKANLIFKSKSVVRPPVSEIGLVSIGQNLNACTTSIRRSKNHSPNAVPGMWYAWIARNGLPKRGSRSSNKQDNNRVSEFVRKVWKK